MVAADVTDTVTPSCHTIVESRKSPPLAMTAAANRVFVLLLLLFAFPVSSMGQGRLEEPPSRSFKAHDSPPPSSCSGPCDVCGDPSSSRRAVGASVRTYAEGSTVNVSVRLTANRKGFFEFRMCPVTAESPEASQECLDRFVLSRSEGGRRRHRLPSGPKDEGQFNVTLRLPAKLVCQLCVFQWTYTTGKCKGVRCGPRQTFRDCADVTVASPDLLPASRSAAKPDREDCPELNQTLLMDCAFQCYNPFSFDPLCVCVCPSSLPYLFF